MFKKARFLKTNNMSSFNESEFNSDLKIVHDNFALDFQILGVWKSTDFQVYL